MGRLVARLRGQILDGRHQGERLNEVWLAAEHDVSRTPVRHALQALAGEGLVEHVPNKGFRVRQFGISEILDAFDMRALAEGLAARLAAERGFTPEEQVEVEGALAEGERALSTSDVDEARKIYSDANARFHAAVERASCSRLVGDVIALCQHIPYALSQNVTSLSPGEMERRQRQHHQIYEALVARRPREAQVLMQKHVDTVRQALSRGLAQAPAFSGPSLTRLKP